MALSNSNGKTCSHSQDDLMLHFYGELPEEAIADLEARLVLCEHCREHFASLKRLEDVIPKTPSVQIEAHVLQSIRNSTSSRLSKLSSPSPSIRLIPRVHRGLQWGVVTAVVLFAFFIGRSSLDQTTGQAQLAANEIDHFSSIDYNANSGIVRIEFDSKRVEGGIEDENIQLLLGQALTNDADPSARFRAAQTVSEWDPVSKLPDEGLVQALQQVLNTDPNDGMKLYALKAIGALFVTVSLPESLHNDLITVLLQSKNSALRMEAMALLTRSEMLDMDLLPIFEAATADQNPLIRNRAEDVLSGFQGERPLEVIQ